MKNFRRETSPTSIVARQGFKTPRRQRGEFLSLNIWKNCLEPVKVLSQVKKAKMWFSVHDVFSMHCIIVAKIMTLKLSSDGKYIFLQSFETCRSGCEGLVFGLHTIVQNSSVASPHCMCSLHCVIL